MGFKNFINSKKLAALTAVMMLGGTNLLMAQTAASSEITDEQKSQALTNAGYYVLLFLLICLVVAIVGRILKVYELTNNLQGKKAGTNYNKVMGTLFLIFLAFGLVGAYWSFTVQGSMTLPEAASKHGVQIDHMFTTTTVFTMFVFFVTQILLFGFAFLYKSTAKRKAHFLPHNNTIEKVWTIVPAVVLTVLVVFGFTTWRSVMNSAEVKGDINIDITGHQFAWELRYPGKDGKLGTKNYTLVTGLNNLGIDYKDKNSFDDLKADTLVIPVNKSIRLNILAQDVIHSVYMPYFRVQLNAVPGLPTFFKFVPTVTTAQMREKLNDQTFEYKVYCAKICGGGHYNMQKIIRVVSDAEYQQWLTTLKPYLSDPLKKELKLADAGQQNSEVKNRLALNN
ncbi:cytochrome c oxidase subunit 2 [Mucilaginibacter yixingensis]|uniref:Cytochrome c oxidase subunit 2 n=1 Tax=Mucilaginibacter yixingensis TaxID=1295612 RepID=A0A2T5J7C9_9SPHI|nr:cytochrome c oxidase subunit II [Mucilaginibacter yixingensis]PTQ94976.1 cytochrome c oxidase subunit 2 [Mucilaginibacter yixingensis]